MSDWTEIAAAYQRLFAQSARPGDAKIVHDDLKSFCAGTDIYMPGRTKADTAFACGMHRVWQRIDRALAAPAAPAPPESDGQASLFDGAQGVELAPGPLGVEGVENG